MPYVQGGRWNQGGGRLPDGLFIVKVPHQSQLADGLCKVIKLYLFCAHCECILFGAPHACVLGLIKGTNFAVCNEMGIRVFRSRMRQAAPEFVDYMQAAIEVPSSARAFVELHRLMHGAGLAHAPGCATPVFEVGRLSAEAQQALWKALLALRRAISERTDVAVTALRNAFDGLRTLLEGCIENNAGVGGPEIGEIEDID